MKYKLTVRDVQYILKFIKAFLKGKTSDEFVTLWAENWVRTNKEILDKFD